MKLTFCAKVDPIKVAFSRKLNFTFALFSELEPVQLAGAVEYADCISTVSWI